LEVADVPIYRCSKEHLICSSCRSKITVCPECRVEFRGPPERYRYAERTVEEIQRLRQQLAESKISVTCRNILQIVDVCEEWQKDQKIARLLEEIGGECSAKIVVFVETKKKADELTRLMRKDGWPALCIHSDKQQRERDWVLGEFKNGSTSILVATDVVARSLDVDDVKFVINYDYPNNIEDYIHRISCTGRRGNTGTSYTLFTPDNATKAKDLVSVLSEAKQVVNPKLTELVGLNGGGGGRRGDIGDGGGR